ncbi:hypothetical protein [Novipirellula sp.]|uniref:hypothetical protein n=1 Tax=Novipirellula sp. TaxID=2795430 RepID=UPI003562B2AA
MSVLPHRPSVRIAKDTLLDVPPVNCGWPAVRPKRATSGMASSHLRVLQLDHTDDQEGGEVAGHSVTTDEQAAAGMRGGNKSATRYHAAAKYAACSVVKNASDANEPRSFDAVSSGESGIGETPARELAEPQTASLPIRPNRFDLKNYTWFGLFIFIVLVFSSIASA